MTTIDRLKTAIEHADDSGTVSLSRADACRLLNLVAGLAVDPPQQYRHYKGPLYQLICEATFEADEQPMVVYRAPAGSLWVRYKSVFEETMEVEGRHVRRFDPVQE